MNATAALLLTLSGMVTFGCGFAFAIAKAATWPRRQILVLCGIGAIGAAMFVGGVIEIGYIWETIVATVTY